MPSPILRIRQPGLMTVLTRLPRPGWQRYGLAPGGAMDPTSLRLANLLVRNPASALALEIALSGPALEALEDLVLAVAGADLSPIVDDEPIPTYRAVRVSKGSLIRFGERLCGARLYLAVAGGLALADEESSAPTAPRRLNKGEVLFSGRSLPDSRPLLGLAPSERPEFGRPTVLRVLSGPQWDRLSSAGQAAFLQSEWKVSHESSRTGIRLQGEPLGLVGGADIASEPTPLGTIQVPASGLPIILMADRPTTGGYAKIATVISADVGQAGQLAPSDTVRFEMTSLGEAQSALSAHEARLQLIERMATWPR